MTADLIFKVVVAWKVWVVAWNAWLDRMVTESDLALLTHPPRPHNNIVKYLSHLKFLYLTLSQDFS
jgi:hypothetical protein